MRCVLLAVTWLCLAGEAVSAAEIRGEIGAVDEQGVAIIIRGGFEPRTGDKFAVLVVVPDVGEATIAQGEVTAIDDGIVIGKIVAATGKVAVGHKVKIDSPHAVRKTPPRATPAPILGKIGAVIDKEITVVTTSQVDPAVGDKVEVFVDVPDVGRAIVGVGKVTAVEGGLITARIEQATGMLAFGQQVLIGSSNPPPVAINPPTVAAGSPSGPSPGSEVPGLKLERTLPTPSTPGGAPSPVGGAAPAVWIGLGIETMRDDVLVNTIIPDSPGARAGFRRGDRLKTLDGGEVFDAPLFMRSVSSGGVGRTRRIEVTRGEDRLTFELMPEPRPTDEQLFARMKKLAEAGDHDAEYQLAVMYEAGTGIPDRDVVSARRWMRAAAEAGVAAAQGAYGLYLVNGIGGEKNPTEGTEWTKKAAAQRFPSATLNLGRAYRLGLGVEKDEAEARHWYAQALTLGSLPTLLIMGQLYENGELYEKDPRKAAEFYRAAAHRGYPPAQAEWGRCLLDGIGVEPDDQAAEHWARTASDAGDPIGHFQLALMYSEGRGVAQDREAAVNLYRKAAALENERAMFNLGAAYHNGLGVQADYAESYRWLRAAADRGFVEAYYYLGNLTEIGRGVPPSDEQAVAWYRKAAEAGHAQGQYNLARMLVKERGVDQNDREALNWYHKAALQNFPAAEYEMGVIAMEGRGVEKDMETAYGWFKAAANHGHAGAQYAVGFLHENGQGVARNQSEAIKWYERAADQNDALAIEAVKRLGK